MIAGGWDASPPGGAGSSPAQRIDPARWHDEGGRLDTDDVGSVRPERFAGEMATPSG
jgi:hypothetical protein